MRLILFIYFLLIHTSIIAQRSLSLGDIGKAPLDTSVFYKWPTVEKPLVSNDGKYVLYSIDHQPSESNTLIIQALDNHWKVVIPGGEKAIFTNDSQEAIFMQSKDSLCLLTLGGSERQYIYSVNSFSVFMNGDTEWLAYKTNNAISSLVLRNLKTGQEQLYAGVDQYLLSMDGGTMVIRVRHNEKQDAKNVVQWINIRRGIATTVWNGTGIKDMVLDGSGAQLAFITEEQSGGCSKSTCWYYRAGTAQAVELADDQSDGIDTNLTLSTASFFSKEGGQLFVSLKEKRLPVAQPGLVKMSIWSYTDAKLQSQQFFELGLGLKTYQAVINLDQSRRVIRLQQENEDFSFDPLSNQFALVTARNGESSEFYWSIAAQPVCYLVTTSNGSRRRLEIRNPTLSYEGKYVLGYYTGQKLEDLWSYEIATGTTRNITKDLLIPSTDNRFEEPETRYYRGLSIAGWLVDDAAVLIYDRYDIWQVDPTGKKQPIRLTNGRGHKLVFRLTGDHYIRKAIQPDEELILSAFNEVTKENGFYKLDMAKKNIPKLLYMGNYRFGDDAFRNGFPILKARDANVYVVSRQRADQSPNVFWTRDFKTYVPISVVYPEDNVNWLRSKLVSFKTVDGINTQAVFYKPEDFDFHKKYPVIIHYYNKKSDELNKYWRPAAPNGELDIAWFVSHGYLVLIIDIHYKVQHIGESIYNSVVAAANYLSKLPFVDAKHMGIQGHSFGGYETNYLLTHSKLFAAGVSSSGSSDIVSEFSNLWPSGSSKQEYVETRSFGLAATPWEQPNLYVKNSPIFYVGQVTTPILMVQNKNDLNVHYEQGLEFFTALRRAGKRVWWLEYDNGGHGLHGIEYKDYVIRMTQFFDHYLKGAPAPRWMTRGIPARMRGVDNGLELDKEIKTPGPGLTMKNGYE